MDLLMVALLASLAGNVALVWLLRAAWAEMAYQEGMACYWWHKYVDWSGDVMPEMD